MCHLPYQPNLAYTCGKQRGAYTQITGFPSKALTESKGPMPNQEFWHT